MSSIASNKNDEELPSKGGQFEEIYREAIIGEKGDESANDVSSLVNAVGKKRDNESTGEDGINTNTGNACEQESRGYDFKKHMSDTQGESSTIETTKKEDSMKSESPDTKMSDPIINTEKSQNVVEIENITEPQKDRSKESEEQKAIPAKVNG